jgi:hypothetical protein
VAALVALYGVSVVAYSLIAAQHLLPDLFPDEVLYSKLSQSFAQGHGLSWRGSDWGLPPLWPVLLSLVWHTSSTPHAYMVGKVLGSALACATVFPAWLLAREFVGPRLALLPAFLCVALPSMETTAFLVSDNLAYPLATASLGCTVMAVRTTRARWIGWSLLFAVPAALARTQMLMLPVILVLALVIDVIRQPRGERRARAGSRPAVLWVVLIAAVTAGLLAFVVKPGLTNYAILANHASLGHVLKTIARHFLSSIVMFAVIPVAITAAMMSRADNWRDDRSGPVLTTLAAGAIVLYPVVGRFEAFATPAPVDRYAIYLAPLLFLAFTLAPGRIDRFRALVASGITLVLLLYVPLASNFLEQPALYGLQQTVRNLGSDHVRFFVALVVLPLALIASWMLTSRNARRGLAVAAAASIAIMLVAAWTSQKKEIDLTHSARYLAAPRQLDWVDRRVDGPVATLNIGKPETLRHNNDLYTDIFNKRVTGGYATVQAGGNECLVRPDAHGTLRFADPNCRPWPRYLVVLSGPQRVVIAGEHLIAAQGKWGQLVRIPPGSPRISGR